ncbi:MAG: hypothetical protein HOW73_10510 [Polyangiaceae bacterium]|nr:hypothetical protein [Polyangiaceae bacterium]
MNDEIRQKVTLGPLEILLDLLSLPPNGLVASFVLLAFVLVACELLRIGLTTELTRSAFVHVTICFLTVVIQSVLLGGVLVYASYRHPGRGWINLAVAFALFVVWYAAGASTRLVRKHNEGADVGFMTVGGLITFPAGIVAALLFH